MEGLPPSGPRFTVITIEPEYSYDDLREMSKIKRKMVFRDLLKQVDRVTVIEFIHHLGIGPIGLASNSGKYGLVQSTLHALVDDGIVSKLQYGNRVKYELRYRNRETSTQEEILFNCWEDALSDKHGWYKFEELQRITRSVTTRSVDRDLITEFLDYVNDRDQITIRRGTDGGNGQRYYIDSNTDATDRYSDVKEKLPAHPEIVDEAVSRGHRPSAVAAAVEWLCTEATQHEMAEKYGCSDVGIRRNTDWIEDWLEAREEQPQGVEAG